MPEMWPLHKTRRPRVQVVIRAYPAPLTTGRTAKVRRNRRRHLRAEEATRLRRRIRRYGPGPNASAREKVGWRRFVYSTEQAAAQELAA